MSKPNYAEVIEAVAKALDAGKVDGEPMGEMEKLDCLWLAMQHLAGPSMAADYMSLLVSKKA